jgi:hypothetical protein
LWKLIAHEGSIYFHQTMSNQTTHDISNIIVVAMTSQILGKSDGLTNNKEIRKGLSTNITVIKY